MQSPWGNARALQPLPRKGPDELEAESEPRLEWGLESGLESLAARELRSWERGVLGLVIRASSRSSWLSTFSVGSALSGLSAGSVLSLCAAGCLLCLGSFLSVASVGSCLSVFSVGSFLSVGCVGESMKVCWG